MFISGIDNIIQGCVGFKENCCPKKPEEAEEDDVFEELAVDDEDDEKKQAFIENGST